MHLEATVRLRLRLSGLIFSQIFSILRILKKERKQSIPLRVARVNLCFYSS